MLDIERASFAGEQPWTSEMWWSELAGVPEHRTYLAASDMGRVVGYAGARWADAVGDVMTVAVHSATRRRGIGGLLVTALLEEAMRRRVAELTLEVRDGNDAAASLYASHGFVAVARRRGYYGPGVDGVLMRTPVPRAKRPQWEPS